VRRNILIACTLPLIAFACAPRSAVEPAGAAARLPAWKQSCQAYAAGPVELEYRDAPGGAAVIYRTRASQQRLRERADEVARFHNSSAAKTGTLHDLSSIPHRAYVEDVDGGVKLVLVAKTPRKDDLDRLRWNVQQDVSIMQRRGCQSGQEAL
jgi:hypothetical protein